MVFCLLQSRLSTNSTDVSYNKPTDLERYIYLVQLFDSNEILFYYVVMSDPTHFLPILYDLTVGEACLKIGHIYRRPRGMYISMNQKGRVRGIQELA